MSEDVRVEQVRALNAKIETLTKHKESTERLIETLKAKRDDLIEAMNR